MNTATQTQPEQAYISVIQAQGKYYLLIDKDTKTIVGWHTEKEAVSYYEELYNNYHYRNYEGSMSACLNAIMMRPSICLMPSIEELQTRLLGDPPHRMASVWCIAGGFTGTECRAVTAKDIWESGRKPRLISDPADPAK
jgi:hypothetical protein